MDLNVQPDPPDVTVPSLHHIGFVVTSIREAADNLARSMEASWDGRVIDDPRQVVRVAFLRFRFPGDPLLELVEPAESNSPVLTFLRRGGGLHHLCYEVDLLDRQMELSRSRGGVIVKPPLPAVAFEGRRIAWVYTRDKLLLEYLER